MSIKVYQPGCQVTLFKLVQRKNGVAARYAGADRIVDLTPFLGEGCAISTQKSIRSPAGGFSLTFGDRVEASIRDTLYALIEPMDMIEIRMSRTPHLYAGQKLPLVMRGFVSNVRRLQSMGGDGHPDRKVIVSGQDFGKMLLIHQVIFETAFLTDQPFLDTFKLQATTGIDVATLPVSEFMTQLITKVINDKIAKLAVFSSQQVRPFTVQATVPDGSVFVGAAGNFQGPHWNLVQQFCDAPWNEAFVRDAEDGPVFIFRPNPFRVLQSGGAGPGDYIMHGATDPGTVTIDAASVVSIDVSRTDSDVGNFFFVPPGRALLDTASHASVSAMQEGQPLDFAHGNNDPVLYGVRKLALQTNLIPDDVDNLPKMLPPSDRPAAISKYVAWNVVRSEQLKAMNRDNGAMENGGALVMGSETLIAGQYVSIKQGDLQSDFYCSAVSHSFVPFGIWTTSLELERGNGFVNRNAYPLSPYYGERAAGPYSA